MHSSFKISNLSDSQPLNIGVPSLYKVHSDRKSEEIKIFVDLSLEVSKLCATTDEQEENTESSHSLKVEPHSFSLVSTTVTKELLLAEERARAREAKQEKSQETLDSNDSEPEPSGHVERRRLFGGVKASKPNTRDPGKVSKVETQNKVDTKQIFRRSQLEKARALSAGRPSLPTAPIPVSDLPPSAVRSPPSRSAPLNPLLQNLKPIPPSASASPVKPSPGRKPDLISIQVPMAAGDGTQTMQTINIPRSVLAGASDRPILLTVTPKNGINKGQKQIVVLTKNNSGQTTASCHVPKPAGSVSGSGQAQTTRTIISTAGQPQPPAPVPPKSVQLSPRSGTSITATGPASPVKQPVVSRPQPQQQVIRGQIVQTSAGQMLVQGNKQILLGKNVLQNGKLVLSQAQLAALTDKTPAGGQTGQTGQTAGLAVKAPAAQAQAGQTGPVRRTMISASQLQSMMAGGQKVVSVGTNSGGQRVVRVISGANPKKSVIQHAGTTTIQNGSTSQIPAKNPTTPAAISASTTVTTTASATAGSTPGATASLSRILTALHNRGLVSQHQNGKFYYVGDKSKSPASGSPGSGLKIAASPATVPARPATISSSSVAGITSLKAAQSLQSAVVVAPAASLDSFTADSDMMQAATSLLSEDITNGSGGSTEESHTDVGVAGQESFVYRDPALPTGWYIKVGKRQVGELSYEVEVAYFSPQGARLRSQEELSSYLTGQFSASDLSHRPPISLDKMPWRHQLDEINKQLAPILEIKNVKRTAPDSVIMEDKRFKPDSFLRA